MGDTFANVFVDITHIGDQFFDNKGRRYRIGDLL